MEITDKKFFKKYIQYKWISFSCYELLANYFGEEWFIKHFNMKDWLKLNTNAGYYFEFTSNGRNGHFMSNNELIFEPLDEYRVYFQSKNDLTQFKLRWS